MTTPAPAPTASPAHPLWRAAGFTAAATAALLLVPALGMLFTSEVNWAPGDFAAAALLLFAAGMAYALASRRARSARQRLAIGALVATALALVWAELAVGLFH